MPGSNGTQFGRGSPFVTSTDGTNDMIVWAVGTEPAGDDRLHGFDGETGNVVYDGGGPNELIPGVQRFNTGIAARGRIYIAAVDKVYAFKLPGGTPTPTPGVTPTVTPTSTVTPTITPTATPTLTPPVTPTATPRVTPRPRPTPRGRPTPPPRPLEPIRIVDQNGERVSNGVPSAVGQTFDVTVGQGFAFAPREISIMAGDTVR